MAPDRASTDHAGRVQEVSDLNALGMVLSPGRGRAVWARLRRAEGAFWSLADFWACKDVPLLEMADLHALLAGPCALCGAAAWTRARETMGMILLWESRVLCKVLG